jgi:hypothetical protein
MRAILAELLGEVEHLLGAVVRAHLRVGQDAIAKSGFEFGGLAGRFGKHFDALGVAAQTGEVHPQRHQHFAITGFEFDRCAIGCDGVFKALQLVEHVAAMGHPRAV